MGGGVNKERDCKGTKGGLTTVQQQGTKHYPRRSGIKAKK